MNLKIEQQKDMLADLLYLNHKKYIRIDYETDSCIALIECDLSNPLKILWNLIATHPGIRIEELLSKKSFLVEKDLYKKACYEEAMRIGIIERNIFHSGIFPYIFQWIFLVWISLLFLFLFQESATFFEGLILSFLFTFGISLCVFLPFAVVLVLGKTILFQDTNYIRTKAGKEDVKYWYAYSNFLKDFTNIQDKNLKYNVLYDHTFPYSISLGLNKKIREEFFLEREKPI